MTQTEISRMTVEEVCALDHCYDSSADIHALAGGQDTWSALEILDHPDVPFDDKLWLVLREDLIPAPMLHEIACRFAETVSHLWEDPRCRAAVDAKRAWLRGEIDDVELAAAREAAGDAARDAARDAAGAAALKAMGATRAAQAQIIRDVIGRIPS